MRILQCGLPVMLSVLMWAGDDTGKTGYVHCSQSDKLGRAPMFPSSCVARMAPSVDCGEKVTVVGRTGPWLQIVTAHGLRRSIPVSAISQDKVDFVAFDLSALPVVDPPSCDALRSNTNYRPPRLVSHAEPEYSAEARREHIEGTVLLSLTVGTDGVPHDVKVEKGLGYGLDEKARQAVENWRFEPAQRDGKPAETTVRVDVSFHLYGQKP
ncbi:hypothetical protein SBA1_1160009 [Candidatus Sulfotelmatobacter kueseliae]|uniref:TonB C-terminal domain-containing protein n=1 Tax=Candidatus Sulfotelmatobacter kueseliae TaxID=2042962 RepID=A0A2U3K0Z3_9BACT|nr:hypothetical protein SBA1_1160009 [Candidatus Sulfotelmatobacter kueseliae]